MPTRPPSLAPLRCSRRALAAPLLAALAASCVGAEGVEEQRPARDRFDDLRGADATESFAVPDPPREGPAAAPSPAADEVLDSEASAAPAVEGGVALDDGGDGQETAGGSDQTPVATLQLDPPRGRAFVLHATVPVPDGFALPAEGRTPFALRAPDGSLAPCQTEVVARGPSGAPDVVQVLAPVSARAEGAARTERVSLVRGDFPAAEVPRTAAAVDALLAEGPLLLRARDVYGNPYVVDLLAPRTTPRDDGGFDRTEPTTTRSGVGCRTVRSAGVLAPRGPEREGPPLSHLMGVHAHLTTWANDPRVSLDLRVHNGLTAGSAEPSSLETPAGLVYWQRLELVLPEGWEAVPACPDPFLGRTRAEGGRVVVPLVRPPAPDRLHMMGPQGQLVRRLTLRPAGAPAGDPALDGLAFCIPSGDRWSWSEEATGKWFPQRAALPTFEAFRFSGRAGPRGLAAKLAGEADHLADLVRDGGADGNQVIGEAMGWAHPWFAPHQGATGGVGIQFVEGHRAVAARSADGVRRLMLVHRMNVSRHPVAMWTANGEPVGFDRWLDADGRVPFDFRTHNFMVPPEMELPCEGGPPASQHVAAVVARDGRPDYDLGEPFRAAGERPTDRRALLAWWPHDGQHLVRFTKNAKALVWLANDGLAKDDVRLAAERFRLMFHDAEHEQEPWSDGVTLRQHRLLAESRPHTGLPLNRDHAWGIDAAAAWYSIAPADERARWRPWFEAVADLIELAAMPNGLEMRLVNPRIVGGRYDAAYAFQEAFLLHARRCLVAAVFDGVDGERTAALDGSLRRGLEYLLWEPLYRRVPAARGGAGTTLGGPAWGFAVAPLEGDEPPFCYEEHWGPDYLPPDGVDGGVEFTYPWDLLAWAERRTRATHGAGLENRYLGRATALWFGFADHAAIVDRMMGDAARESGRLSGNWCDFVARVQELRR